MIITEKNLQDHIFHNAKWQQIHHLFKRNMIKKELYSTIVAVVEVVALFKDCFEQTSKWSLDVCKMILTIASYVIGQ